VKEKELGPYSVRIQIVHWIFVVRNGSYIYSKHFAYVGKNMTEEAVSLSRSFSLALSLSLSLTLSLSISLSLSLSPLLCESERERERERERTMCKGRQPFQSYFCLCMQNAWRKCYVYSLNHDFERIFLIAFYVERKKPNKTSVGNTIAVMRMFVRLHQTIDHAKNTRRTR
jgi:hypothetical protein